MTNRIVGNNSGIEVDKVVKESLSKDQVKIDKAYQKQKTYEYQQEQLVDIIDDSTKFWGKYLDRIASGSLLNTNAYETVKFTSSDGAVSAKGYAGADVTDYKVSVNSIAKKAITTLDENYFKGTTDDENCVFSVNIKNADGTSKEMYLEYAIQDGEIDMSSLASKINSELKKNGVNASAKYSEFAKGIVLESGEYGESVSLGVAVKKGTTIAAEGKAPVGFKYSYASGENAKGTISKGSYVYQIDSKSNMVTVDNVEFTFNSPSATSTTASSIAHLSPTDFYNNKITFKSLDGNVSVVRQNDKAIITKQYSDGITIKTVGDSAGTLKTSVSGNLAHLDENDKDVVILRSDEDTGITVLSKECKDKDGRIGTKITEIDTKNNKTTTTFVHDGITITTVTTKKMEGKKEVITTDTKPSGGNLDANALGDKYKTIIESNDGKTRTTLINGVDEKGNKKTTETTVTSDNDGKSIQLVDTIVEDGEGNIISRSHDLNTNEPISLSGKTDVTGLKDTIIKFIGDYNTLMEKIDTKLWEKRDKDYAPLTAEQKKEMSDKEIEEWEKKAKTGLLRGDSDLRRIQSAMKSAMGSLMSGTGLTLEKIGIKPINNYTTKNGMYEIDESTLTKALESNAGDVKDLFTRPASGVDDKGGVLVQLQKVMYSEFKTSSSLLSQRAGLKGTSTESEDGNTLGKNIKYQKKLIEELQKKYKSKEDALYKKYSNLEVMLEKLNAQNNSLISMLGTN